MLSFYRVRLKSGIRGHMTINRIKYAELAYKMNVCYLLACQAKSN